jgi:MFS family permease
VLRVSSEATKVASPDEAGGILRTWQETPLGAKALIGGTFVNRFGGFLQFFVILYLTQRGYTNGQAALASGFYAAGSIVGVLIGGSLSDLIGPRLTIVITMVATALNTIAILYIDNFVILLVAITVLGGICQMYRPASSSILATLVHPSRQVMVFSMYRLAVNAATTLCPLVAVLIIAVSWDLLFYVEAITILLYAVIIAMALRGVVLPSVKDSAEQDGTDQKDGVVKTSASYLRLMTDGRYMLFLVAVFAISVIYVQSLTTLPLLVEERWDVFHFSVLLALNGFVVITCELYVSKHVQHWKSRTPLLLGSILVAGGMMLFGLPLGYAILVIGTIVWTTGEMICFPMLFETYPAQVGPENMRGRYLGAANGVSNAGMSIGPIVGIALYDRIGTTVWFLCGIVGAISVLAVLAGTVPLPRDRERDDQAARKQPIAVEGQTAVE